MFFLWVLCIKQDMERACCEVLSSWHSRQILTQTLAKRNVRMGVSLVFKSHPYSRWCSSIHPVFIPNTSTSQANISQLPPELLGEPGPDGFLKTHQVVLESLKKNKGRDYNLIMQSWALAHHAPASGTDCYRQHTAS